MTSAKTLDLISDVDLNDLFSRAAEKGAGIELNFDELNMDENAKPSVYRIFEAAKANGCKFYFGSDAHHPGEFVHAKENFTKIAGRLALSEDDKFHIDRNA